MIFVWKAWEKFCIELQNRKLFSIPACEVCTDSGRYVVLKHDVETDVSKAYRMAMIENKYGHRGSYYVQAYLMHDEKNVKLLQKMQEMGHEISYHYDVMDSNKGDINQAIPEFEVNLRLFDENGFKLKTLCQHGNPIVERVGYTSNRDFFRSEKVRELYPELSDIMVDFKDKYQTDYLYFSDAGRHFQLIFDPINNDIVKSDDKNILCKDLKELVNMLSTDGGSIISTHPHRWTASAILYIIKATVFYCVKFAAKLLMRVPPIKRFLSRYYYLAKKI